MGCDAFGAQDQPSSEFTLILIGNHGAKTEAQ